MKFSFCFIFAGHESRKYQLIISTLFLYKYFDDSSDVFYFKK